MSAKAILRRLASPAAPTLAVVAVTGAVVAVNHSTQVATTYAVVSLGTHAADLAAGLSLVCVGLLAWSDAAGRRFGALVLITGALWFANDWEGWDRGPALVRSLGAAAAPLLVAVVFHLVLAAPRGRIRSRPARAVVAAAYAVALATAVGRALYRDPLLDPYCWRNCLDNVFLVHADQGIAWALDRVWLGAAVATGALLLAMGFARLATATSPTRRILAPVLLPGALVGATYAAYAIALLRNPLEVPANATWSSLFYARSLALVALAAGILWTVARDRRRRAAVIALTAELGEAPPPGKLRDALAVAVGDGALEVAYWLPASGRYVGADGKPVVPPAAGHGRTVTPILRGGRPLAVVVHDATLIDGAGLARQLGPATQLAVENERLQAEVLAQLEDLRASRARIVENADATRRRLERDLHDGAQQRLLALSYDIRIARGAVVADEDPELTALLDSAAAESRAALAELRELAHGIYPAILGEAGLAAALTSLAEDAPLPVELGELAHERYVAAVETAAYLAVAEAIDDASRRDATYVSVDIAHADGRMVVTVADDGVARGGPLTHLADRIGALGGSIDVGATILRAEIPCA